MTNPKQVNAFHCGIVRLIDLALKQGDPTAEQRAELRAARKFHERRAALAYDQAHPEWWNNVNH